MLQPPFRLLWCSWPRPVEQRDGRWISDPDWAAPPMPCLPSPRCDTVWGEWCWLIDWRGFFRGGLKTWSPEAGGEMRCFHVIFEIELARGGRLAFWDDDGSIIRRKGRTVHEDRSAHMLQRSEIEVEVGDRLLIAQWQLFGGWLWGATFADGLADRTVGSLLTHVDRMRGRVERPSGPPLKMFTNGASPARSIIALYSMIANGYAPGRLLLYGEHQWSPATRDLFQTALPFAEVVPTTHVVDRIRTFGGHRLVEWALRYWWVMKTCVALLTEPFEFCQMDDDVLILASVDDALAEFHDADLVFVPDTDHGNGYQAAWGLACGSTARFNAGLYWMRMVFEPHETGRWMLRVPPGRVTPFVWEQGFIATRYATMRTVELPTQRYFYPLFDGLPGGILGYDYRGNPCGFASLHFGGLREKPSDEAALLFADEILAPERAATRGFALAEPARQNTRLSE